MTCHQIPGVGILCSGRGRSFRCQVIGCSKPATALCDHELPTGRKERTCSARLCDEHRHRVGADRDLCPFHAPAAATEPRQGDLFGRCPAEVDGGRCAGLRDHDGPHYANARDRGTR